MTQDATQFSVTVPTVLPVAVSAEGIVTVANENNIINHSFGPVEVKSVSVQSLGDWKLVDFNTDFKSKKVGLHEYGFQMNDTNIQPDGSCAAEFEVIPGNGQTSFVYDSKVAAQNTALDKENIANIVFTVGWNDVSIETPQAKGPHRVSKKYMDTALQRVRDKITFKTTAYQGNERGADISEATDGSVIAIVTDGSWEEPLSVTVYSDGGIYGIDTVGEKGMFTQYIAKEIDLSGVNTSNMTNMSYMFYGCSNLESIDLKNFDFKNVGKMKSMFCDCFALKNIDFLENDLSLVTDISYMFAECKKLQDVNLSGTNLVNATDAKGMFHQCISLKTLDLSNINLLNVEDTRVMFEYCNNLVYLDLSGVNMSKVTQEKTYSMFDVCDSLETCYGRTQEDCDILNKSPGLAGPNPHANFVVKPT